MSDDANTAASASPDDDTAETLRELDVLRARSSSEGEYQPGDDDTAEPGVDAQALEVVATLVHVTFEITASRRGPHWRLSEQERDALAQPLAQCIEKYAPELATGPEAALVLAAGMICAPRLMTDRQLAAQRERARAESERTPDGETVDQGEHGKPH